MVISSSGSCRSRTTDGELAIGLGSCGGAGSNFLIGTAIKWSPKSFFLHCALLVKEKVDADCDWVAGADEELHEVGADVKVGGILDRGSEAPAGHHLVGMILGSAAPACHQRSESEVRQCLAAGRKPRDMRCRGEARYHSMMQGTAAVVTEGRRCLIELDQCGY